MDRTNEPDFLEESVERLLSWEYIHGSFCAQKKLRPCRLAERLGVPSAYIQNEVSKATEQLREKLLHRNML